MMNEAELFGEADFEQAPCEFCDELFPFDLLIQHQSGCRPDIAHYTYRQDSDDDDDDSEGENVPIAPAIKEVTNVVKTPKILQEVQQKADNSNDLGTDSKKAAIGKALKVETKQVQKSPPPKEWGKSIVVEDPSLQETKLMSYGSSSNNRNQQVERERPSFKVPSPLNNADQRDLDEESRLLSDSDEGSESLEEFWNRADIKNSQRLRALPSC